MRFILVIIAAFLIVAIILWLYMQTGFYNIAASVEHFPIVQSMLSETLDRSVHHHAKGIQPPATLKDPNMLRVGFIHYDEMCAMCHGAPGIGRSEVGEGLYPEAPSLAAVLDDWTPSELYWITKNGIKMSGMPSFGKTHTDDELWAIVAFVLTLPNVSPELYLAQRRAFAPPGTLEEAIPDSIMMHESHHGEDEHEM